MESSDQSQSGVEDDMRDPPLVKSISEIWKLEREKGSVLQGKCYSALRFADREDGLVWTTLDSLDERQAAKFNEYVEQLLAIRDWGDVEFGLDGDRRGFVALVRASTKPIDFDAPNSIALRNRFIMALALVERIHGAKLACGNLNTSSFVVDSLGLVWFVGFLGGFDLPGNAAVTKEIQTFLPSDKGSQGNSLAVTDVYSLAVMGLTLFGARFPGGVLKPELINDYLGELRSDAPPWVLSVLVTVLRETKQSLCRNVSDLLHAIAATDAEYLKTLKRSGSSQADQANQEKSLSIKEIRDLFLSAEEIRKRRIESILASKALRAAVLGFFGFIVAVLGVEHGETIKRYIPFFSDSRQQATQERVSISEMAAALNQLKSSQGNSDQIFRQGVKRGGSGGALVSNPVSEPSSDKGSMDNQSGKVQAQGNPDSHIASDAVSVSQQQEQSATKLHIAGDNVIFRLIANGQLTTEEQFAILQTYNEIDDSSKVRLALAFLRAGGDLERSFRSQLEKRIQGSAVISQSASQSVTNGEALSSDAMFLAAEPWLSREAVEIWADQAKLRDAELLWLAQILSRKRSPYFPVLAQMILDKKLVDSPRDLFLSVASAVKDDRGAPYDVLYRLSRGEFNQRDVALLVNWGEPVSISAVYAVILASDNPEIVQVVSNVLASKPEISEVNKTILQSSNGDLDDRAILAPVVAALGVENQISDQLLRDKLQALSKYHGKDGVLEILLTFGTARVVGIVLELYGPEIHPEKLIQLLDRSEPSIRKAAIPFLKEVRLASSKARIREHYEGERDLEVKRIYETQIFSSDF